MRFSVCRSVVAAGLSVCFLAAGCSNSGSGGVVGGGGSGGDNDSGGLDTSGAWLIPQDQVVDGGPGLDGIPSLQNPSFRSATTIDTVEDDDLVIVIRTAGQVKVYPHDILDYHEVVNDGPADAPYTMSYCPLTGSALAWHGNLADTDQTYGVSGLLFNNNLLMYDRESRSIWSQMLQVAVSGDRIQTRPEPYTVVETRFSTLKMMYPDAMVMTRETGHARDYDNYPYGNYRTSEDLLFPIIDLDNRAHPKELGVGIHDATSAKVYQLSGFGDQITVINDEFAEQSIVVVGNSAMNFALIYSSELADGTVLSFAPLQDDLPNVMTDTEGNVWNIFGEAVSGPRTGSQLAATTSYIAMWFAWPAHFSNVQLHFNQADQ